MNGRRIKIGAILMMSGVLLMGMERTPIPASVCTFVDSYKAVEKTDAPMGLWERFVYTAALTKIRFTQCKMPHGAA